MGVGVRRDPAKFSRPAGAWAAGIGLCDGLALLRDRLCQRLDEGPALGQFSGVPRELRGLRCSPMLEAGAVKEQQDGNNEAW